MKPYHMARVRVQVVQSPFLDVFAVSGGSGGPGHVRGVCSVLAPEQVVLGHQRAISNYLCGASDTLVCALRLGKLSQSELTKAALKYAFELQLQYALPAFMPHVCLSL